MGEEITVMDFVRIILTGEKAQVVEKFHSSTLGESFVCRMANSYSEITFRGFEIIPWKE